MSLESEIKAIEKSLNMDRRNDKVIVHNSMAEYEQAKKQDDFNQNDHHIVDNITGRD